MKYDVIIIGSGPAALTAAIYNSRAALKTLVLAGQKWGGQLMLTTDVENYPGFPKGIQGPELMDAMRKQAERFGAEIKEEEVTKVDLSTPVNFKIFTKTQVSRETTDAAPNRRSSRARTETSTRGKSGLGYTSRAVIIATGASTRWLGVPGEAELIGRGVSSCAPCDAFFFKDKKVIVVGGGDSAMEEAIVLTKFASHVTIVHRRDSFRASQIMQDRVLENKKIRVLWNSEVVEVLGKDKLTAVKIKTKNSKFPNDPKIYELPIDGLFVAIGHTPNTAIFKDSGLELDQKGYIKRLSSIQYPVSSISQVDKRNAGKDWKQLALKYPSLTSVEGVFVAGDVADYLYRQAVTAAGYGCQAAMDAQRWLEEKNNQ